MKQTITHYLKNQSNNQHIQKTQRWPPTIKYGNNKHNKIHRANHENIKKLWRTVENTPRQQSYSIGHFKSSVKRHLRTGHFNF